MFSAKMSTERNRQQSRKGLLQKLRLLFFDVYVMIKGELVDFASVLSVLYVRFFSLLLAVVAEA